MTSTVQPRTYNVGGITAHVYARPGVLPDTAAPAASSPARPASVLFVLHGRGSSAQNELINATAVDALAYADAQEKESGAEAGAGRELIVVSFDHRNHGARTVDAFGNEGWSTKDPEKHNERHAVDMYAIQTGTARDVSFLIDFLPAYLFPNDERTITAWGMLGVSLGGHATWLALAHEPRLTAGIPVIGCPDYLALMNLRADKHSLALAPPYLPSSLRALIQAHDPAAAACASTGATNPLGGKRVLVLSGAADKLVPWTASASFVERLQVGEGGRKEVAVLEGVGHEYTTEMREVAVRFVWEEMVR